MATVEQVTSKTSELVVGPRDILFMCPACGKSLIVDEAGVGMIVDCPQCHINVIVPPKPTDESHPVATAPPPAPVAETDEVGDMRTRLVALGNKLKELQTQRTEINNRLASRMNDINRDLVMMARLETSHQQLISELHQVITQVTGTGSPAGRTRVNLRS